VEPAASDAASPPVRKASWVPGGALWPSWRRRTKNRFGSRTEDFTDTRTRPLGSGGKVETIGRGGATEVVFASGVRAGTTEGRRSAAGATEGGVEGGWLATGGALAGDGATGAVLGGAGGGALLIAGMVPEVPVEAGGGIGAGALLCRAEGGGGGVALGRAEGGGGGLDRPARGGCGRASGGRE
jgi:hypothetical protein